MEKQIESRFWICSDKEWLKEYNAKEYNCVECGKKVFYIDEGDEYRPKICVDCFWNNHQDTMCEKQRQICRILKDKT